MLEAIDDLGEAADVYLDHVLELAA